MTDSGTLATTAQVLLEIGQDGSTAQVLEANTNIWILYAESEIEKILSQAKGSAVGIVANYGTVTATLKQWIAAGAAKMAAWEGINQDQDNWSLATTQSKLNILDVGIAKFKKDLESPDIATLLGL